MEYEVDADNNNKWCLGKISKGLERRLEAFKIGRQMETIQTTALLRLARILR